MINKNNYEFLGCVSLTSDELINYEPLAGSYAVAVFQGQYLICFNTWRKQWEIPAGGREIDETPEACAIRELFEETGQIVHSMNLKGILKVRKPDGSIKNNPIYFSELEYLLPFKENDETDRIMFWDVSEHVEYIDEIDKAVLEWCNSLR